MIPSKGLSQKDTMHRCQGQIKKSQTFSPFLFTKNRCCSLIHLTKSIELWTKSSHIVYFTIDIKNQPEGSVLRKDVQWLLQKPIAHRGLHSGDSECPENSLKAFERAMRRNFPFELDVRLLADGNVCVFHDENTGRMTGVNRSIKELSAVKIKKMSLLESDQKIPLLEEVLSLIRGNIPLLIEIKNEDKVGELENAVISVLSRYRGKYALVSFNPYTLRWFRENLPEAYRGQLAGDFQKKTIPAFRRLLMRNLLLNSISKPDFICYDVRYLPSFAASILRTYGIPIIGWTVRSHEELKRVRSFCDNIVFEGFDPE
jgi:glycerophosphoryl diester phosphodiesterase